mmetsp:Transcript_3081/g.5710  ORF Transcript_3081/g.5710 Transcript_3081/m.5710 type:complete len:626 (-) Transcript_3081:166-2043(-)
MVHLRGYLLLSLLSGAFGAFLREEGSWPKYGGRRRVLNLDGEWEFGLRMGKFDSMSPSFSTANKDLTPNSTTVPSCFDAAPPGYAGPRGVGMYRTKFEASLSGGLRVWFGACSFYCRVFLDGKEVGDHRAGGYVAFYLDVPAKDGDPAKEHELFVLADNRFNHTTAPLHTGGDFWHYGGIMRSVVVHELPADTPLIWRVYVHSDTIDGVVNASVVLTDQNYSGDFTYELSIDGSPRNSPPKTVQVKNGRFDIKSIEIPDFKLWSPDSPNLHKITVVNTKRRSQISERFGIRKFGIEAGSGRLTVNGKVLKLMGWNHHTQFPKTGASPTNEQLDADAKLLLDAHANYVRGSHYPQDQRWLDRMDEAGILMWEETLGPDTSVKDLQDWKVFMPLQLKQIDQMIDASFNHPSIVAWGWFNEGPSDHKEACPAYAACAERAKLRDPSRFRTWASNRAERDQCLEHATMVSFNSYPGWYEHEGNLSYVEPFWKENAAWVKAHFPEKPFTISETGAGGVFEWNHNKTDAKWTLKYQTEVIQRDVEVGLKDSNISGFTLWHLYDFKGNDGATASCGHCDYVPNVYPPICGYINVSCSRPGGLNHKGSVDFWRRIKPAYKAVSVMFKNASTYL